MEARKAPFTLRQRTQANLLWAAEHFLSPERFRSRLGARKQRLQEELTETLARRGEGRVVDVERVHGLDPREFRKRFHPRGVPAIFAEAAKDWTCCRLWTPDYFAEHYAEELGSVTDYGDDPDISLKQAIEQMSEGRLRASHFSKVVHNHPELIGQLDLEFLKPYFVRPCHQTSYQFFMGPQGAQTPLHSGGTNNFHIQIHGEKTWWIVDTSYSPVMRPMRTKAPLITGDFDPTRRDRPSDPYVDVYRARLRPGDVLYVPTYYWHHVSYDTISIASGVRWFSPLDVLTSYKMMFLIMATATNPSVFEYYLDITRGRLNRFYGSRRPDRLAR